MRTLGTLVLVLGLTVGTGCGLKIANPVFNGQVGVLELHDSGTGSEMVHLDAHWGPIVTWAVRQLQSTGLGVWFGLAPVATPEPSDA